MTQSTSGHPKPALSGRIARTGRSRQRRAHQKSKNGCISCKARRQKCDEQKPICSGCTRYSTECLYPTLVQRSPQEIMPSFSSASMAVGSVNTLPESLIMTPADINLSDLELFHQYMTSTCITTSQKPEITTRIQLQTPCLAQNFPFVMHGILAMAAVHLSRLRPSQEEKYSTIALRYHSQALPAFNSAIQNINEQNCHALIAFSKGLVWSAFAAPQTLGGELNSTKFCNDRLPDWFYLLRGSCLIVESAARWIKDGPYPQLVDDLQKPVEYAASPDDDQILTMISEVLLLEENEIEQPEKEVREHVLSNLRDAFARAAKLDQNTPLRNAINGWVGSLPQEYMILLQEKKPWALITLAHFCLLVHRLETVWFMKGQSTRLMLSILENLDSRWNSWVQWPCRELGIEVQ